MAASTFEQPGRLGRGVRLVAGMTLLALFIETLLDPTDWLRETAPTSPGLWIGAAMCVYFLRGVPDKGFGRSWGRWPQLMVGVLALVAIVYSLAFSGNWWGQPLGALLLVLILYVTGHLGLSFVLAGMLGQPG
jgi:hypothetical protein